MKYYLKIYIEIIKFAIKKFLENRIDFFGQIFLIIIGTLMQILVIEVIYSFTRNINGWTREDALILLMFYRIFHVIYGLFFAGSINRIPQLIADGNLDLILTKPLNSQFYLSSFAIAFHNIFNFVSTAGLSYYALRNVSQITIFQIIYLLISVICAVLIFYSLNFFIATISILVGRFHSFQYLQYVLMEPLSLPIDILPKAVSFIFTFIIPLIFITTIPAKIFLGQVPWYFIFIEIGVTILILKLSSVYWNFSLKHYTSASS